MWLEIGFGGGEHLVWQASCNPAVGIIGAEPFINGVAKLLVEIDSHELRNVRVHPGDARDLLEALAPASLTRLFVLFPDPWPKTRHHKRRIVNTGTIAAFARVLAPGGNILLATDSADYQRWTLEHMLKSPDFTWTARSAADWRGHPDDPPPTRYQIKAERAGRRCAFLTFRRLPDSG